MKHNLVILPGYSSNPDIWQAQIDALKDVANCQIIIFKEETTIEAMAERVLQEAPEQFMVAGHSMGGWIAQRLAIMAPERVQSLSLICTWAGNNSPEFIEMFEMLANAGEDGSIYTVLDEMRPNFVSPTLQNDVDLLNKIKAMQDVFPETGYTNQARAMLDSPSVAPELSKVQCPSLIIYGQDDGGFSLEDQRIMFDGIQQTEFTQIPNCGHMPMLERPEALSALMRLWVAGKDSI